MGIISALERRAADSIENPRVPLSQATSRWIEGGGPTKAGVRINESNALTLAPFFSGVQRLAVDVAKTPLGMFEHMERGRKARRDHHVHRLLALRANPDMSAFQFKEVTQGHAVTWGGGYAEIERNRLGEPINLWPITPDRMRVIRKAGQKVFMVRVGGSEIALSPRHVLHIPGFGYDGLTGYSVIRLARESLGLLAAAQEFGATWFGNGSRVSGVLEHPKTMTDKAHARLKADWDRIHTGLSNAHRAAILEEGMSWKQTGIPPEDAQFLQTRQFQVTETARWLLMPPHKLGDLTHATFSNIEHMGIEYVQDTLVAWFTRWESECSWSLLNEAERGKLYAKFNANALLRGDSAARATFYQQMFQVGAYSPNDILELEDENPVDGGDTRFVPLNMVPLELAAGGNPFPSTDTPPKDPADPTDDDDEDDDVENDSARNNAGGPAEWRRLPEARRAERRAKSADARKRLQKAHVRVFEQTARGIVSRETRQLRRILKAELGERSVRSLEQRVDELYEELLGYIERKMAPAVEAYGASVFAEAAREIGFDEKPPATLTAFVRQYVQTFARRYISSSKGQLRQIITQHVERELVQSAIETRLEEWDQTRAQKVADRESVESGGAVARWTYMVAGIMSMRWVTVGENCPLCSEMDGRTVGVQDAFLKPGDRLNPGGDVAPLVADQRFTHPPIHQGCDCVIAAA